MRRFQVPDQLVGRSEKEVVQVRTVFEAAFPDAHGSKAIPRLALTSVLNELVMHGGGSDHYATAFSLWEEARKSVTDVAIASHLAVGKKTNLRNLLVRLSKRGEQATSIDMFEAAILMEVMIEVGPRVWALVEPTLTPYQKYIRNWSCGVLTGDEREPPRIPQSEGFAEPTSTTSSSKESAAQSDEPTTPAGFWLPLAQSLHERDNDCHYWPKVFRNPTAKGEAGFVLFRPSLNGQRRIVQTYLSIQDRGPGEHTFVHAYSLGDGAWDVDKPKRLSRGFAVPSNSALFLIGGRAKPGKPNEFLQNVDLSHPMEVIVLPVRALESDPEIFRGITITANEKGRLLVSRIAVRRTVLPSDEDAFSGKFATRELETQLLKLMKAEAQLHVEALPLADLKGRSVEECVAERIQRIESRGAKSDAHAIRRHMNNYRRPTISTLIDPSQPDAIISGDDMYARLESVFRNAKGFMRDQDGNRFEPDLHIQMQSLHGDE